MKLAGLLNALDAFYEGGRLACLLERLGASVEHSRFVEPVKQIFGQMAEAFAAIALAAGAPASAAADRA